MLATLLVALLLASCGGTGYVSRNQNITQVSLERDNFKVIGSVEGKSHATYVLGMKLYTDAFRNFRMGYACATSWIMFAMMLVMTLALFASSKKWVYYDN